MSSDSDIMMQGTIVNYRVHSNKDTLLEGATREIQSPITTTHTSIHTSHYLIIDADKMSQLEEEFSDLRLAEIFKTKKEEIIIDEVNGTAVMIFPYENKEKMEEVTRENPLIRTLEYKQPNTEADDKKQWIKIRHWPTNADIEHVIFLNDLLGWHGKVLAPKSAKKHTTAVLKAPSETEAAKLLEKGYIVSNGKVLATVPGDSTQEQEQRRTVLLVGVNKVQDKLVKMGSRLTEIGLLKSLVHKGYPIQALKFVHHDEKRISHSAYVLLKNPTPIQDLQPFQDGATNTTIRWAEVADYKQICDKCLSWPEHLPTCSKHANNVCRNINSHQIAKRAAEGSSILMQKLKTNNNTTIEHHHQPEDSGCALATPDIFQFQFQFYLHTGRFRLYFLFTGVLFGSPLPVLS